MPSMPRPSNTSIDTTTSGTGMNSSPISAPGVWYLIELGGLISLMLLSANSPLSPQRMVCCPTEIEPVRSPSVNAYCA